MQLLFAGQEKCVGTLLAFPETLAGNNLNWQIVSIGENPAEVLPFPGVSFDPFATGFVTLATDQ
jgi:hypothetical protein